MGGAVGHLSHLTEDLELTFGELKTVLTDACNGELQEVFEKFDGMNLVFSHDSLSETLVFARGKTDIKIGGIPISELSRRLEAHPMAQKGIVSGAEILQRAITVLTEEQLSHIFDNKRFWYSVEILFPENANVIRYDHNSLIFHKIPVFEHTYAGVQTHDDVERKCDVLFSCVKKMQRAIEASQWRLMKPVVLNLQKLTDKTVVSSSIETINREMKDHDMTDVSTLGEFLHVAILQHTVLMNGVTYNVACEVADRCVFGSPSLTLIKKRVNKSVALDIVEFVESSQVLIKEAMYPIEVAVHNVAVQILNSMNSILVSDNRGEVDRLKIAVKDAIKKLDVNIATVSNHIKKLGDINTSFNSAIEGVVFNHNGKTYKFTGAFAPINQLLGAQRYKR